MSRTPENLVRHELIGLPVRVVVHDDPGTEGLEGEVVDETMNTLGILAEKGRVTVPKKGAEFLFELEEEKIRVDGDLLVGRPEDRVSKKLPGKWGYVKRI